MCHLDITRNIEHQTRAEDIWWPGRPTYTCKAQVVPGINMGFAAVQEESHLGKLERDAGEAAAQGQQRGQEILDHTKEQAGQYANQAKHQGQAAYQQAKDAVNGGHVCCCPGPVLMPIICWSDEGSPFLWPCCYYGAWHKVA